MNYKKEAERWQKHYDSMPLKNGLYAPLFKRSKYETDREYVEHCEEANTLMCCMGIYSSGNKSVQKGVKDYMNNTYSDWTDEQLIKLMKT